jgi:low temperature requirement protein LtrA
LPIIAGIIGFAVAIEQTLTHLDEALRTEALIALVTGIVLYLGGIAFGLHRSGRPIAPWVAAAGVGAVAVVVASAAPSGLAALGVATAVLVGFAAWGFWSERTATLPSST